ncbi:MAG: hypothetical protein HY553_17655 [Elusimicrobia bacterium]|nr:hypothetical protein [Elusimicrobiota bacterium]
MRIRLAVTVICLMLIGACGTDERVQPPDDPDAAAIVIAQGTQGRVGDLSIGVSSVHDADYVGDDGVSRHGLVAGLAFLSSAEPPRTERRQVHPGQRIDIFGYSVFVEGVSDSGLLGSVLSGGAPGASNGSVRLRIRAPRASATSPTAGTPLTPLAGRLSLDVLGPQGDEAQDVRPGGALPLVAVAHNSVYEITCRPVTWSLDPPTAGSLDDLGRPGQGVLFRAAPLPAGRTSLSAKITATTIPSGPAEVAITRVIFAAVSETPRSRIRPGPTDPGIPLPPPPGVTMPPPPPSSTYPPYDWGTSGRPVVRPNPANVSIGRSTQLSTVEAVRWDVCPAAFGTVTTSGLFQASTAGVGYVIAQGRRAGTFGDVFPGGVAIVVVQ